MLGRHYAADRLDAGELDRRLDLTFGGSFADALAGSPRSWPGREAPPLGPPPR